MRRIIIFLLLLNTVTATAQETPDPLSEFDNKKTIFELIQQAWIANKKPSTASLMPYISSVGERRIPLTEGEGQSSEFSLLEADLNLSFPIWLGRSDHLGSPLRKMNSLSMDYSFNFRMLLDESKPLTPASNRVGFSYRNNLYNNYSGSILSLTQYEKRDEVFLIRDKPFRFINFLFEAHHYSNGQSGDFFHSSALDAPPRNNYAAGDFSTNYFYGQLTYGRYLIPEFSLFQGSLGYRLDWGSENGALAFSKEQDKSYGKGRIVLVVDNWSRFMPFPITRAPVSYHYRFNLEYITSDLGNFVPNLKADTNKHRLSLNAFFEINPKYHRSVGYFISGYIGRDYLNIRYDDIVVVGKIGLSLSLDKYSANKLEYRTK